jgi:hypothetical protein
MTTPLLAWTRILSVSLLVATAAACTGHSQPPPSGAESFDFTESTPVEDVCESLVDERTESEIGREEVYASEAVALFSHVPRLLRKGETSEPLPVCTFWLDPRRKSELNIRFSWSKEEFPGERQINSATVHRINSNVTVEVDGKAREANIWLRCHMEGPSGSREREARFPVLEGSLIDTVGISEQARTRLLTESARRVVRQMDCKNNPSLPALSELDSLIWK